MNTQMKISFSLKIKQRYTVEQNLSRGRTFTSVYDPKHNLLVAQTGPVTGKRGRPERSRLEIAGNPSCDELASIV